MATRPRPPLAQLDLALDPASGKGSTARSSTFHDNLVLPIHRWFRYSAGFSATWCQELLHEQAAYGRTRVLDPFVGSGTVLLEAEFAGVESIGIEAHPFIARVARAKLLWSHSPDDFLAHAKSVLRSAMRRKPGNLGSYPPLIERCFKPLSLEQLDTLRAAWSAQDDASPASELTWLVLAVILRKTAAVGTAQWQYVLPNKVKTKTILPYDAFELEAEQFFHDMYARQSLPLGKPAQLLQADARELGAVSRSWADLVVTSPPYANNYDYADATRLEMSFFGEIGGWGDLQESVRKYLIRSCTQHAAPLNGTTFTLLEDPLLAPIRKEIVAVCEKLNTERSKHGGNKPYHAMIAAYFLDLAQVLRQLRRVTRTGALMCFVIGDSAPYGVYVPVDTWLGELAIASGFVSYRFEKTRDRNIKWKNRKHRVPLHEGRLWISG